jgi:hypothetical protein
MRLEGYDHVENIAVSQEFTLRPAITGESQEHGAPPVEVSPAITLTLVPLPPDWDTVMEKELPTPKPKLLGILRDQKGRPIIVDGKPIMNYETEDENYQTAMARHGKRQTVMMVLRGIEEGKLVLEAQKDQYDNPGAYYDAVLKEMMAFGVNLGDVVKMSKAIGKVSGITEEDVDAATRSFFDQAG